MKKTKVTEVSDANKTMTYNVYNSYSYQTDDFILFNNQMQGYAYKMLFKCVGVDLLLYPWRRPNLVDRVPS